MRTITIPSHCFVIPFVFLLLVLGPSPALAAATLDGQVLLADGTPAAGAYVEVQGQNEEVHQRADENGRFHFEVQGTGGYFCWVSAPKHQTVSLPLLLADDEPVELEIRLATCEYVDPLGEVSVIGDFNDLDREEGLVPMQRREDGLYEITLETEADSLAYQLMGVQIDDFPLSGTRSDRLELDFTHPFISEKGGKYVSIVYAADGEVDIVFDPDRLPRAEGELRVEANVEAIEELVELRSAIVADEVALVDAYTAHVDGGGDPKTFEYDYRERRALLGEFMDDTQEPRVREYALLQFFQMMPEESDSTLAMRLLDEVPVDSPVWSLIWAGPNNLWWRVQQVAPEEAPLDAYASAVVEEHPDAAVRAPFLYSLVQFAKDRGDSMQHRQRYELLMSEYPGTTAARRAKATLDPDRRILPGYRLPDFALPALEGDSTITRESLLGRTYLLDFWATWCGPCVAEMDQLHEVHERFQEQGFTILSVSFDRRPRHVHEFREEKWPMPWLHSYVDRDLAMELHDTFEIPGIPRPILVGPEGKILAEGVSLRGDNLLPMIEAVMGER